ncbi:hypothetical protein [Blastococcus saxobsidens]|uniref:hypothetical protein n=1 Tax=Blastococcus saxobsidens TaxID=138336 RepID=UPI001F5F9248|nr:hypothetical protein [Blastococcus saxobsidens]
MLLLASAVAVLHALAVVLMLTGALLALRGRGCSCCTRRSRWRSSPSTWPVPSAR